MQRPTLNPAGADRGSGVQSLATATLVLQALAATPRAMALKEIVAASGLSAPKVHRYLASWIQSGLVVQDPASGHYDLGPFALRLGLAAMARSDAVRIASEALPAMVRELGHSVLLAVWGSHGPTVIRWEESGETISVAARVGAVLPLAHSATGRLFAAFPPHPQAAALLEHELTRLKSATDRDRVVRAIGATRREGVARVVGDLAQGVSAVAAPVFDLHGRLVLALTCAGATGSIALARNGPITGTLQRHAAALSERLGYSGKRAGMAHSPA